MPPEVAPLLKAAGVDAGYGTMQVLWGVDLDVRPGETVLLLGANGAGKTTFLKTLVGLIEARHGSIDLGGHDVTRMRSSDRMRLGMTYMSELAVFPDLSIEENIRVGAQALGHANPGARAEELYGVFPALREKRTVALAQQARMKNPDGGYDPLLEERMRAVLPACASKGIKIVTNMGAANPVAASRKTAEIARSLGLSSLKIAAVIGDDVLDACKDGDLPIMEFDGTIKQLGNRLLSANAYLGAAPMAEAFRQGADIVITGRASDPALFLAPMIHAFGWAMDDWNLLGQGTVAGHLLECAGQITGGYFADPGYKDIPDLARLGFPIGEVGEDGSLIITKVEGSGGAVTAQTCKEQLLYEVHDPARYIQPDVVADFSEVKVEELAKDRVRVSGGRGTKRTGTLKVSVGYVDSFIGEGQISYAGPGALARGRLALEIVRERLKLTGVATSELRFELIGVDSLHGPQLSAQANEPYEVRVRVAGRTETLREAVRIGNEVETLYTNGPAAGGGAFKSARDVVAVASVLLPRELAKPSIQFVEA